MGLKITKFSSDLYEAIATPPHVKYSWSTNKPIPVQQLIKELKARGCHQQDIGDALYEQDEKWIEKL